MMLPPVSRETQMAVHDVEEDDENSGADTTVLTV
jgi:hypothetical protein